ncbi:hypothetical protein [Massilia sp. SYSU DXS3249]
MSGAAICRTAHGMAPTAPGRASGHGRLCEPAGKLERELERELEGAQGNNPGCKRGPRPGARPGFRLAGCVRTAVLAMLPFGMAGAQPVSPAEVLLFETDHLARIKAPATLVYEYRKQSNVEPAFTDSVQLDVSRDKGQLHAVLHFLTGERKQALPEIDDAHGNPVLLGFLEHDIAEMKRLTGGSVGYFRKRIRLALANGAQVTPQRISYGGKTVEAKAVRIQPYLDDPLHARFENYVRKTYTFVLSDQVPGGVYRVSTTLANAAGSGPAAGTVVARTAAGGKPPGAATQGAAAGVATAGSAMAGPAGAGQGAAANAAAGVARTGGPAPASGAAKPGMASAAAGGPSTPSVASRTGAAAQAGVPQAATPGPNQPGAAPGAAMPVIDETLTLVKVTEPRR